MAEDVGTMHFRSVQERLRRIPPCCPRDGECSVTAARSRQQPTPEIPQESNDNNSTARAEQLLEDLIRALARGAARKDHEQELAAKSGYVD
jgi:hypothetical protein